MDEQAVVTLYVDPISPYVWLALGAIGPIEAAGARVHLTPVLFAGMLNAHGNKGPAEIEAKRAYTFRDVMRQAAQRGLPFAGPPGHPFNPLLALRMCTALTDQRERRRLVLACVKGAWERGLDISSADVMASLARDCDLDGDALLARAQSAQVKQALADATAGAIADGVFGVPTFACEGELFWGGDRVDALLWRLQGNTIDEARLEQFLGRAPLAQRKR